MRKHRSRFYLCQRYQHLGTYNTLTSERISCDYPMHPEPFINTILNLGSDAVQDEVNSRLLQDMFEKSKI